MNKFGISSGFTQMAVTGQIVEIPLVSSTGPSALCLGWDSKMYGTGEPLASNNVWAYDTVAGTFQFWTIPTANAGPGGICRHSDGVQMVFTCLRSNKICVLDPRVTGSAAITEFAWPTGGVGLGGVTLRTSDNQICVCETTTNKLAFWDPVAHTVGATKVAVGTFPHDPLMLTDGSCGFCNFNGSSFGRVKVDNTYESWTLTASGHPYAWAQASNGLCYITEQSGNNVVILDPTIPVTGNKQTIPALTAACQPRGICQGANNGDIFFTQNSSSKIGVMTLAGVMGAEYQLTAASTPIKILALADSRLAFAEQAGNCMGTIVSRNVYVPSLAF
jgi:streptogramin lyase